MSTKQTPDTSQQARRVALVMAGTGVFWIVAIFLGSKLELAQRTRALFDLMALAGFGWALVMTYGIWRQRQKDKG